jgi:hypothetical protein
MQLVTPVPQDLLCWQMFRLKFVQLASKLDYRSILEGRIGYDT